nr:hypothetical protein [Tanacetum cinerariifolium]
MILMVERNHEEHLIRRFPERGNELGLRDVKIASLKQRIQELKSQQEKTRSKRARETLNRENPFHTDIDDVIEEEEGFVEKGRFSGEEDNIEDTVVVANDIRSSMIQTTLSVDVEEYVNTKSHELMSFGKNIIIKEEFYLILEKIKKALKVEFLMSRLVNVECNHSTKVGELNNDIAQFGQALTAFHEFDKDNGVVKFVHKMKSKYPDLPITVSDDVRLEMTVRGAFQILSDACLELSNRD